MLELLVLRPIIVGWRRGKEGETFRVLGRSGPALVHLDGGAEAKVLQPGRPVDVQPHDVIGWVVYADSAGVTETAASLVGSQAWGAGMVDDSLTTCLPVGDDTCGQYRSMSLTTCVFRSWYTPVFGTPPEATAVVGRVVPTLHPRRPRGQRRFDTAPFVVRPSLDVWDFVEPDTTYEEFMTLRQRLDDPDLGVFEDKIRLRRELLPSLGVAATPSIHLSNTDFNVIPHIRGRGSYVVKPSHMSNSDNVVVVCESLDMFEMVNHFHQIVQAHEGDGRIQDLFKQDSKLRVSSVAVQKVVDGFRNRSAVDWECNALVHGARPGVIVEELVLGLTRSGSVMVVEFKFFVVWGEVVAAETQRYGNPAIFESDGRQYRGEMPRTPPQTVLSAPPCYHDLVLTAEKVAAGARADFLRVDLLLKGNCSAWYVSEVELFPAADFSLSLRSVMAERWRHGYGVFGSREVWPAPPPSFPAGSLAPGRRGPFPVRPSLDISASIAAASSYQSLLAVRSRLSDPDVTIFEDKIRLRRELLPAAGVLAPPSIHVSNTDFSVLSYVHRRSEYVVKPSHLCRSDFVFLVQESVDLLAQKRRNKFPWITVADVQSGVDSMRNATSLCGRTFASRHLPPGIIIETLVLFQHDNGVRKVNEYRFYAAWGEVVYGEKVYEPTTAVWASRAGKVLGSSFPLAPDTCMHDTAHCIDACYGDMVASVEKLATYARLDFARVDVLIEGACQAVYISKVRLLPSIGNRDRQGEVFARWRAGYATL